MSDTNKQLGGTTKNRREKIKEIIINFPIRNQDELVEKLRDDYGIDSNQSTVSRDIKRIGIVKNKETNCYQLDEVAKKEREKEELEELLIQAEATFYDTELGMISFRTNPEHAHLVAARLESYFSNDDDYVATFVNPTGAILLLVSKGIESKVREELNVIFE